MSLTSRAENLQEDRGPEIVKVAYPVAFLATLAVVARFFSRKIVKQEWELDDYAIAFALVLTWACVVSITFCVHYGAGKHIKTLSDPEIVRFQKNVYAINEIYIATPAAIKIAALLMYKRIFHVTKFKAAANRFIALICAWWIAETVAAVFLCWPIAGFWNKTLNAKCVSLRNFDIAYAVVNITVNVTILVLPLRTVWRLKIRLVQKIALSFVFLIGAFECVASLIRLLVAIVDISNPDLSYVVTNTLIWSAIEPSVGVISVCLITLRPLLSHMLPKHFGSNGGHNKQKQSRATDGSFTRLREYASRTTERSDGPIQATIVGAEGFDSSDHVDAPEYGIRVTTELELHTLD